MLLGALLAQFTATYVTLAATRHELWPAIVLPGFAATYGEPEMETERLEIEAVPEQGSAMPLSTQDVFADMPPTMRAAVTRNLKTLTSYSPQLEAWLLGRAAAAAGTPIDGLTLTWVRRAVSLETGEELWVEPQETRHVER